MATTQPRIFTFSKGGGSKGDKSMKELVSALLLSAAVCAPLHACAPPTKLHANPTAPAADNNTPPCVACFCRTPQLGGKGANLCEMAKCGVNIPPGLTITTEVCEEFYRVGE